MSPGCPMEWQLARVSESLYVTSGYRTISDGALHPPNEAGNAKPQNGMIRCWYELVQQECALLSLFSVSNWIRTATWLLIGGLPVRAGLHHRCTSLRQRAAYHEFAWVDTIPHARNMRPCAVWYKELVASQCQTSHTTGTVKDSRSSTNRRAWRAAACSSARLHRLGCPPPLHNQESLDSWQGVCFGLKA